MLCMNFPYRKEARQAQAKLRQEAYDKLSTEQKLFALPQGGAAKQFTKLAQRLDAEQEAAEVLAAKKTKKK